LHATTKGATIEAMQSPPDLSQLSHEQKDQLILALWPLQEQVQQLMAQVAALQQRVAQLEARLAQSSKNSSRPPSSDGLSKPAPKSLRLAGQRPTGGQKGHRGNTLRVSQHIDAVIQHHVRGVCSACQHPLPWDGQQIIAQRQVLELPALRLQVIEHQLMQAQCACGAIHQANWPIGAEAAVQYGASVKALAVHLNQHHLLPLARTAALLQDLYGVRLSQASIQAFAQEGAAALGATVCAIGQAVQSSPIAHADESGIRVTGQLHWLHCLVTQRLTWLAPHAKRGSVAIKALGLLASFKGTLVHDGLASYKELACTHSLCNAHHLRELVYVHENEGEKIWDNWAQEMIDLLRQALCEVNQAVNQTGQLLPQTRQAYFEASWSALLERGEALNMPVQRTGTRADVALGMGSRGRAKQSKAHNLLKRLRLYRADVWRFMTDKDVPFTNNVAEQALRMCKVKQKISGCFRTQHGAATFFTIRSYLATMSKQKANLHACLVSVFQGHPIQPCFVG
jgi:transposase